MTRLAWFDSFGVLGGGSLLTFLLACGATFSVLGFAALRNRGTVLAQQDTPDSPELDEILRFEPGVLSFRGERLDVATEAQWTMTALAGRAARQGVGLELAVSPGLAVWMDRRACRKLLVQIVGQAIADAPGGRVLLTGCPHGGRVQIGVTHDGQPAAREALETALRPSTEIAALNGGTLEVKVRAGQGATVLVRMPEPAANPAQASDPTATAAAATARQAQRTPQAIVDP
jgi:hypothetical protein